MSLPQLLALALTLSLEIPMALLVRRWRKIADPAWRFALVAASTSLISHPLVWPLVTTWLQPAPFWQRTLVGEPIAVAIETLIYWKLTSATLRQAFLMALLANAVSFGVGLLVGGRIFTAAAFLRTWLE